MSATVSGPNLVNVFSQVLQTQLDNLPGDQKKILYEMILSQLSPADSPASDDEMATPRTPPIAQIPQTLPAASTPPTPSTPSSRSATRPGAAALTRLDVSPAALARRGLRHKYRSRFVTSKKGVNAFMVFRTFYSPLLTGLPQKVRSGLLSKMWRSELRRNHFHLLGEAYSVIRDTTVEGAGITLNSFLQVTHKFVGIIPAEQYLLKAGWNLVDNDLVAVPVDSAKVLAEFPLNVTVSTADVTAYCHRMGLIARFLPPDTLPYMSAHGQLSFTVVPAAANGPSPIEIPDFNVLDTPVSATSSWADEALQLLGNPHLPSDYNPSMAAVTFDQQSTYDQTPAVAHWNPAVSPPILGFDPTLVQNPFDPFDFNSDIFFESDL